MASIRKTKTGRFKVQWREGGRSTPQHSKTFDSETEAKIFASEVRIIKLKGEKPVIGPRQDAPSLKEVHTEYIRRVAPRYSRGTVSAMAVALNCWENWLIDTFGDEPSPELLTRRHLQDYREYLGVSGTRNQRTINVYLGHVQRMWAWAYDDEVYEEYIPKPRKLYMPPVPSRLVRAPTWAQMDEVIAVTPAYRRLLPIVLRFTGLRVGQVMRLVWSDVDLENAVVTIRGELGKTRAERAGRVIPISRHLVDVLRPLRGGGYVIPFADGNKPDERSATAEKMLGLWRKTSVPEDIYLNRPHHAFRKGFVSGLTRLGADVESVEMLVGHKVGLRGSATRGDYLDPSFLPLKEAIDLIPPMV